MVKVSVIVPIYNVEKYLKRCIDSLVEQTQDSLEIVLVNDGSTDGSSKIATEYAEKYSEKIKYVEKQNGGLSDARNYGMKYATGEYIAFLDSDDYAEKDTYKLMYEKAKEENADYVECDFLWEYPNKIKQDKRYEFKDKKQMLSFVRVVAWNKLIKREILEKNNIVFPKGLRYEDVEFTYKLIPYLEKTAYVDKCLIHYTQRNDSIANVQNERTAEIFTILDNVIEFYKENGLYEQYKTELEYNYARYLLCSSLKRILKIKDKPLRKKLLKETCENLNKKFPNWSKNEILKTVHSGKHTYMRMLSFCLAFYPLK